MFLFPITLLSVGSATVCDLRTRRIPNLITFSTIAVGLVLNFSYQGISGLGNSLLGMFLGIMLFIIPFALRGMGAGDVKLLAAVGTLNGSLFVLHTFLYGAIAGGIIAICIAIVKKQLYLIAFNVFWTLRNLAVHIFGQGELHELAPVMSGIRFPYGIAILAGAVATYFLG